MSDGATLPHDWQRICGARFERWNPPGQFTTAGIRDKLRELGAQSIWRATGIADSVDVICSDVAAITTIFAGWELVGYLYREE